jgi:hypothetical protein
VSAAGASKPVFEDHFLRGDQNWSAHSTGGQALLVGDGMLHLRTTPAQPWLQATASGFGPKQLAPAFTEEATLNVHPIGGGSGGMLFAEAPAGAGNAALAAVVDGAGRVAIVAPGPHVARTVAGPIASGRIRTGYGLNTVRVAVQFPGGGKLRVQVSVNGGKVLNYAGPAKGLAPSSGIVAAGKNTSVAASAVRVWD